MNVAIVIQPFGRFGGGEKLSILHAIGLAKKGYDVTFYTDRSAMNPSWIERLSPRVPVEMLPHALGTGRILDELGRNERILVHHHVDPVAAFRIVKRFGKRTLWYTGEVLRAAWEREVTGQDYRSISPSFLSTAEGFYGGIARIALRGSLFDLTVSAMRLLDRMTVYRYCTVIANSNYMAALAARIYHYEHTIPVVYPCPGIEITGEPSYGAGDFILAVGALTPSKNHVALIHAASLLSSPPNIVLVGTGPESRRLNLLAHELGISLQIRSGLTDLELAEVYRDCAFVAVPSLSEPFGMTALEGALAGKPAIVTRLGGTSEFVLAGQNGLVFNPSDFEEIAKSMAVLLGNSSLREKMGRRARERAEEFDLENSVESLVNILES